MATFLTPAGSGSKSGASPTNAMGTAEFTAATITGEVRASGVFSEPLVIRSSKTGIVFRGDNQAVFNYAGAAPQVDLIAEGVTIQGCRFSGSNEAGVRVNNVGNSQVLDNQFDINNKYGVFVYTEAKTNQNLIIRGNEFEHIDVTTGHGGDDAILFFGASGTYKNVHIVGNKLLNPLHAGINLPHGGHSVENIYVHDNDCEGTNLPYGRFIDTKINAKNVWITHNRVKGMRAPSQLGGKDLRVYCNEFTDQRNVCHSANDEGCVVAYNELNTGVIYWGAGYAIGLNEIDPTSAVFFANNTINGADQAAIYIWQKPASLTLRNNIFSDVTRKASNTDSPPGSETPNTRFPIWVKDQGSAYIDMDNNIIFGDSTVYAETDTGGFRYSHNELSNAQNIRSASLNVAHNPAMDANGVPTAPVEGVEIPDLVDPAGLLGAEYQPRYVFASDWTHQNRRKKVRGDFWDIGAHATSAEEVTQASDISITAQTFEIADFTGTPFAYTVPSGTKSIAYLLHTEAFESPEITGLEVDSVDLGAADQEYIEAYINTFTSSQRLWIQDSPTIGAISIDPQLGADAGFLSLTVIPLPESVSGSAINAIVADRVTGAVYTNSLTAPNDDAIVIDIACFNGDLSTIDPLDAGYVQVADFHSTHQTEVFAKRFPKGAVSTGVKVSNDTIRTGSLISLVLQQPFVSDVEVSDGFTTLAVPPDLDDVSVEKTSDTEANVTIDVSEGAGDVDAVATDTSDQPDEDQIQAGEDHTGTAVGLGKSGTVAVPSVGSYTVPLSNLTDGQTYWIHLSNRTGQIVTIEYRHGAVVLIGQVLNLYLTEDGYCS